MEPKNCSYAVHPGGLKLLQNFSKLIEDHGVKNGEDECTHSFKNLRMYGNLASAAILFILNDVIRNTKKDDIFFMAMGPGVCLEYGGMARYKPGRKSTTTQTKSSGGDYTFLLLAIIIVLFAFIVGGYTLNDLKHLL